MVSYLTMLWFSNTIEENVDSNWWIFAQLITITEAINFFIKNAYFIPLNVLAEDFHRILKIISWTSGEKIEIKSNRNLH